MVLMGVLVRKALFNQPNCHVWSYKHIATGYASPPEDKLNKSTSSCQLYIFFFPTFFIQRLTQCAPSFPVFMFIHFHPEAAQSQQTSNNNNRV